MPEYDTVILKHIVLCQRHTRETHQLQQSFLNLVGFLCQQRRFPRLIATSKDGTDRLSQNVGKKLPLLAA